MSVLKNLVCVAAVFAVVGALGVASALATPIEMMQNGSFENGAMNPATGSGQVLATIGPGTSSSAVWYWGFTRTGFTAGQNDWAWYMNSTNVTPEDGSRVLDVCQVTDATHTYPTYLETAYQSFAVLAGQTYNVSYWGQLRKAPATNSLAMSLGLDSGATFTSVTAGSVAPTGVGTGTLTEIDSGVASVWTNYTYSFVPSANATATVTFWNASPVATTASEQYLDNVSISYTPTPEPGTLALLAAGLAGLLCYAWRKRR